MRMIRLAFVIFLAVILIAVAMANRSPVTVNLLPANLGQYLGGTWSLTLPLFLALFLAVLFGVLVGFIWEWMREAGIRAQSRRRADEVNRLEREVQQLRQTHAAPDDDVVAILDSAPVAKPAPAVTVPAMRS